jgi:hypothetical protein
MIYDIRFTRAIQFACLALLLSLCLLPSALHAQGSLTPPGAPGPTMLSLSQVEPRTPISGPITITRSGSYYLTTNITISSGNAIQIAANNVWLDLNGFSVSSTALPAGGYGIYLGPTFSVTNVTVMNGFISGSVTNNSSGVYGGSGFGYGIYGGGANVHVKNVSVSGCLYDGINTFESSSVVEACTVNTVGGNGIVAQSVSDSTAVNCGGDGLSAQTANNCSGQGYDEGINASIVNNCYGSSTVGDGVYASNSADNCYGSSSTGDGIVGGIANNCYGSRSGYTGIFVESAYNCYGSSGGGSYGIYTSYIASGCYGYSVSGTGIYAFMASVCHAATSSGTTFNVTHNINSF